MVMTRRAGPGDVDELRAIAAAAYQKYVCRIGRAPTPMTADYAQAVRDGQAWAAIEDGQIVGFAIVIAQPGYLLLDNLAVLPAAQGRGIGAEPLALAEEQARGIGSRRDPAVHQRGHDRESRLLPSAWIRRDPPGRARRIQPGVLP